jgi:photosystem II stability/assembly factor-like uncharacterized protein
MFALARVGNVIDMRAALVIAGAIAMSCCSSVSPARVESPRVVSATATLTASPAATAAVVTAARTATPASASAGSPTPIPMPTNVQLSAPSSTVVWAMVAGTRLFRSIDRGDSWQERPIPSSPAIRVSFVSDRDGWLLSGGSTVAPCPLQSVKIWHTTDGAMTWIEAMSAGIADAGCKDGIDFVSSTTGFVTMAAQDQGPQMYRTIDGGRSWAPTRLEDPPGPGRTADVRYWNGPVHAFGPVLLVTLIREAAPGETNFVYRSVDGGASWAYFAKLPYGSWAAFITATRWVQLLVPGQSQETTDAGATWHLSSSDYGQAAAVLPLVEFGDPQIGYATVRGSIKRTLDGAAHWTGIRTPGTE